MRINCSLGYLRSVLEDSKPYARMKLMVVGVQVLPYSVLSPKKRVMFELPPIVPFWNACTSVADPDPYVLGLLDPDPLVRGLAPDPDPSII